ncbi:hypothetical protein RvY_16848 [Ramazzottius varieornatus]|uniref:Receptor ligand binding region domain-containing protein n=1 Tax=Ramazzottius varieornatus TaxID=947166 RepID=A0A1D1VZY9_RAMVA|nr:hypothetical protein RvY_16848 [Ramazzottius varieornatus]
MAINVTVVTIAPYLYVMTLPAFKAGVATVNKVLNDTIHMELVIIARKDLFTCESMSAYSAGLGAEFFYSAKRRPNDMIIFISPCKSRAHVLYPLLLVLDGVHPDIKILNFTVCTTDFMQFQQLTRNWNVATVTM